MTPSFVGHIVTNLAATNRASVVDLDIRKVHSPELDGSSHAILGREIDIMWHPTQLDPFTVLTQLIETSRGNCLGIALEVLGVDELVVVRLLTSGAIIKVRSDLHTLDSYQVLGILTIGERHDMELETVDIVERIVSEHVSKLCIVHDEVRL